MLIHVIVASKGIQESIDCYFHWLLKGFEWSFRGQISLIQGKEKLNMRARNIPVSRSILWYSRGSNS